MDPLEYVERVERRFSAKVTVDPETGCHEWNAHRTQNGYGQFGMGSRVLYAHRAAYEIYVGPIPGGLHIDHLCRNRGCVNPEHLEAVTQRENTLRGVGVAAACARKTHCLRGHEFKPENTYRGRSDGSRECITCRALRKQAA